MNKWDEKARRNYQSYNINTVATKILKYLRYPEPCVNDPVPIKGSILLYDDDADMTKDMWDIIKNAINNIRKRSNT